MSIAATLTDSKPEPALLGSQARDLLAFFAPALFGLLAFALIVGAGLSPVLVLWLWILLFDGPHMLAAYTRAYGDSAMWRERRPLLLVSLTAFVVGPLVLLVSRFAHAPAIFQGFLGLMTVYAYHHVVRQHFGFVAVYAARCGRRPSAFERRALYAGCWLPYVHFVLSHPRLRELLALPVAYTAPLAALLFWVWVGVVALGFVSVLRDRSLWLSRGYALGATLFHGLAYLLVARYEPIYRGAQGPDQEFMVLTAISGIFHSAQYIALVALYHVRSGRGGQAPTWFGAGNRARRVTLVTLPFVALYAVAAWATGVYPLGSMGALVSSNSSHTELALALWWGFALHHYWLDERIWRISADPRLKAVLGLRSPARAA